MNKITKENFINELTNNTSKYIGVIKESIVMDWELDEIESKLNGISAEEISKAEPRKVVKSNGGKIMFDTGSTLYLNQKGEHKYYEHLVNGIKYLVQKHKCHNYIYNEDTTRYIIYAKEI